MPGSAASAAAEALAPSLSLAGAWLHRSRAEDSEATLADLLSEFEDSCSHEGGALNCVTTSVSHLPDLGVALHEPFRLNYLGSETGAEIPTLSAAVLLKRRGFRAVMIGFPEVPEDQLPSAELPEELSSMIEDRVVIIGRVDRMASEDADRHATPYSFPLFSDRDMAGVFIQAQLMEAMLTGRQLRPLPAWVEWSLGGLAVFCAWLLFRRQPVLLHVPIWLISSLLMVGVGQLLFVYCDGIVLELGVPITASLVSLAFFHLWSKAREVG
jgi:CHASE2 domain-containing sensor protein